jgi:hypothetical protein
MRTDDVGNSEADAALRPFTRGGFVHSDLVHVLAWVWFDSQWGEQELKGWAASAIEHLFAQLITIAKDGNALRGLVLGVITMRMLGGDRNTVMAGLDPLLPVRP